MLMRCHHRCIAIAAATGLGLSEVASRASSWTLPSTPSPSLHASGVLACAVMKQDASHPCMVPQDQSAYDRSQPACTQAAHLRTPSASARRSAKAAYNTKAAPRAAAAA